MSFCNDVRVSYSLADYYLILSQYEQ